MLDRLFSEAWAHKRGGHEILGRKLHPLCALDILVLEAINSPFLIDGGTAEVSDLLLAIWLVSNPHPQDCTIGHLELDAEGEIWMASLNGRIDMIRDCAAFSAYFSDYWSLPEMMRTIAENPVTPHGCPWMMQRVIMVCERLHVPLYEAWTMPIGMLIWYCCSMEEMESEDSRIVGPALRERLEQAKNGFKVFSPQEGESLEDFAKRIGVPLDAVDSLLDKSGHGRRN